MTILNFKTIAEETEVNTTNQIGMNGLFGKRYKLGKLEFLDARYYTMKKGALPNKRYFIGDLGVSKDDFEKEIKNM